MENSEVITNLRVAPRHQRPFPERWLRQSAYLFGLLLSAILISLLRTCRRVDIDLVSLLTILRLAKSFAVSSREESTSTL